MNKILLSLATIAVVAAIGIGATVAYFTDTETSAGNIITAGTIGISVDGQKNWHKTYSDDLEDIKPGWVRYIQFTVKNDGTNPARVWKQVGGFQPGGGVLNEPECEAQVGSWSNGQCNGGAEVNDLDTQVVYDMWVCNLTTNPNGCQVDQDGKPTGSDWKVIVDEDDGITMANARDAYFDLLEGGQGADKYLQGGAELSVVQSYLMKPTAGNEYQGDTLSFNIDLTAIQPDAPEMRNGVLFMDNKDQGWNVIKGDGTWGVLRFNTSGSTFDYDLKAYGLNNLMSYNLVYYDTAENVIASLGTPSSGKIETTGSVNLNKDLKDVKIWVRPTPWSAQSDANTLWEYNLVDYDDTDV